MSTTFLEQSAILALSFVVILIGSELFTNGIEWAGHKLGVAEAAVGSLFAAVGTALPETFVPAVALLSPGEGAHSRVDVGIGAIIGAPLMLSTIALFVMGVAVLIFRARRDSQVLTVNRQDARRDLLFFLPVFALPIAAGMANPNGAVRVLLAGALIAIYAYYTVIMLRLERRPDSVVEHGLYLESLVGGRPDDPRGLLTAVQVVAGVTAIFFGAHAFVDQVILVSEYVSINPGVLALILSPLATELPEKYNSVVWIRQGKDHLALANITGAMVFQSCIPVALGLVLTPWQLGGADLLAGAVAIGSSMVLYATLRDGQIDPRTLMLGGAAYAAFLAALVAFDLL
ncbi:MAG: sodium:calcium antiporter [Candidatus Binataceae bacterium]